jgi:uncharacterized protein YgiB involved in biofilm formation
MRIALAFAIAAVPLAISAAAAEIRSGSYRYGSERQCVAAKVFSASQCHIAQANAEAEFDEKSPHFPTRAACEQAVGRSRCMIGAFASLSRGGGKVYFVPQSDGFVIRVNGADRMGVTPLARTRAVARFGSRSIARLNTSRSLQARGRGGGGTQAQAFGVAVPTGVKGELPPAPYSDPNFDCAAVVEQNGDKGDPGCYPVSPGMLRHFKHRD